MDASPTARLVAILGLLLVLAGCTASPGASTTTAATTSPAAPASDALVADVDIGGRTLHLVCVGPTDTGRPTIVFEAGLGGDFRTWGEILGTLKATERGCSYDRAGLGGSDPVATPRTTADQVADLHALLGAAGIPPPYVLVGFSIGGWNAMVYADKYPAEVAGLVFVDVRPPDASVRGLAELPSEVAGESDAIHQNRAEFTTFYHDPSLNPEGLDLAASATQAAAAAPFGDRPVEFLWAGDTSVFSEGLDADLAARLNAVLLELRAGLEARGSRTHSTLVDAPHEIPAEQPGTVVDAVRAVLDALH